MAVSVHLEFMAPDNPDLTTLKIYEATDPEASFTAIETVTQIGAYPNYINEYTTALATSITDWFAIEWIDSKGATTDLSQPVQGDTQTALGVIVDRVMLRDPSINREVAVQEAEAALYANGIDPYGSADQMTPVLERGLTNLTMAMCYVTSTASSSTASEYMAGIVSQKFSDTALQNKADAVKALLAIANRDLGVSFSLVAVMALAEDACTNGTGQLYAAETDQSRLLAEIF